MSNALDADLVALIAAPGSGKTLELKRQLRNERRAFLVWSWKEHQDHYAPEFGRLVDGDPAQLNELVMSGASVVYVPAQRGDRLLVRKQFELFCGLAMHVGERVLVVEEMANVASSRYTPPRFTEIVTGGRSEGLSVKATTQRPTLCDSSLLDAATEIYCGRLNRPGSRKFMAELLDVPLERVTGLLPLQLLRWRLGAPGVELVSVETPQKRRRARATVRT